MNFLQNILQQLQNLGLGGGYYTPGGGQTANFMGIGNITPQQIQEALISQYDMNPQDLNPAMFSSISSGLLESSLGKSYRPQIEAKGQSLLSNLQGALGGKVGKRAVGGFAGSGQGKKYRQQAKDIYGQGMTDVLATTGQHQLQGLEGIQSTIDQWLDTASEIKGPSF